MLYYALNIKIDCVAIKEVLYQATAYLGIGRVYDFLIETNKIMEEYGVKLPLALQGTIDIDSRFEDVLKNRYRCSEKSWQIVR